MQVGENPGAPQSLFQRRETWDVTFLTTDGLVRLEKCVSAK
jgi:hypothetical protein